MLLPSGLYHMPPLTQFVSLRVQKIQPQALAVYKSRPAVVRALSDKIDIDFAGGSKRVRDKDLLVLHPGPVAKLPAAEPLVPDAAQLAEARELLQEESLGFSDFAALLYGDFTPDSAWSAWCLLDAGLYFTGDMEGVRARPADRVAAELAAQKAKEDAKAQWQGMLERLQARRMDEADRQPLLEVERVALGQAQQSRIMDALEISVSEENAHRLLLQLGYWPADYNPHPERCGISWSDNALPFPAIIQPEPRSDFTTLAAWAIDDAGSEDPDDAISIQDDRLYVHIADVAELVLPDSELDQEACSRGANLYLPDRILSMLPDAMTDLLGLGLQQTSPALTVSFVITPSGELADIRVEKSRVAVRRISYADADLRLTTDFTALQELTARYAARRQRAGAISLELPEVNVRVRDGEIRIAPYARSGSRQLVSEAMLAAGEAVALLAQREGLSLPFVAQQAPEEIRQPQTLSEMVAFRRLFKPSHAVLDPAPHAGLGLAAYSRVTSPLRRYLDLVAHQQLHAWLDGQTALSSTALGQRISQAQLASAAVRRTERFSNQHWKLRYLQQHPDWRGKAVVVELDERKMTLLVPELALECKQRRLPELTLDQEVDIRPDAVDLAALEVRFAIKA